MNLAGVLRPRAFCRIVIEASRQHHNPRPVRIEINGHMVSKTRLTFCQDD